MKKYVKKLLGCALALFFAYPVLAYAPDEAKKFNEEILNLLKGGQYEQVKKTLENIPVCPKNGEAYGDDISDKYRCTLRKFTTNPFKMEATDTNWINVVVKSRKDPGYTKKIKVLAVNPVGALKNALNEYYRYRFGKDISEYDSYFYLRFQDNYKGSWLENVIPSVLVEQIWKAAMKDERDSKLNGIAFYNDAKWHEAQGYDLNKPEDYDAVSELKYGFIDKDVRYKYYKMVEYYVKSNSRILSMFFNYVEYDIDSLYEGINEAAAKNKDKEFSIKYKQRIYHDIFTIYLNTKQEEDFSKKGYITKTMYNFYDKPHAWEKIAIENMPEDLLTEMQANVARDFVTVCNTSKGVYATNYYTDQRETEEITYKQICEDFIKNAKEYGLWSKDAESNYRYPHLREIQEAFDRALYHPSYHVESMLQNQLESK